MQPSPDRSSGGALLLDQNQTGACSRSDLVTLGNLLRIAWPRAGDVSLKCLPYQLSYVSAMPT